MGLIVRRLRLARDGSERTPAERSLMARLEKFGPSGPSALAEAEQVTPPVVCATLAALQRDGLVHREADPTDGRRVLMSLTAEGLAAVDTRRSALSTRMSRALDEHFTLEERRQLADVVPLLTRLAEVL